MNALELLECGYGYKEIKSILENVCHSCLFSVPAGTGAHVNEGLECDKCLER